VALQHGGHQIRVLSRRPGAVRNRLPSDIVSIEWNGHSRGFWEDAVNGADVVINLAGEPIADRRWTDSRKQALRESRIGTTRVLVDALARLSNKPHTLINASAIGYYGPHDGTPLDESASPGSDFLAQLCVEWEQAARHAESLGMRVIRIRIGLVLGRDGGALPRMLLPFRLFLGGPIAPGNQWLSWIHRHDLIGLIHWALTTPTVQGPVNCVAPEAVTMQQFCRILGTVLHRPSWLPVPSFILRAALGELAGLLITGQRVQPTVALREGYLFTYSTLEPALRDILRS
jgi:uncharacterized protein (TIGR01777 family)